jgi:hypothetical protein
MGFSQDKLTKKDMEKINSKVTEKTTLEKIDEFVHENCNIKKEDLSSMILSRKMGLINMKSQDKWDEFKIGLRELGYII